MQGKQSNFLSFLVIGIFQYLVTFDFSMIAIALPSIGRTFHASPVVLSGVVSAMDTAYAGCLIFGGRLVDLLGARRAAFLGLAIFGAGTTFSMFAPSITVLLMSRAVTGTGAALLTPCVFSLIRTLLPAGPATHRAFGIFGLASGMAAALGQLLAGFATTHFGWQAVFFLHLPSVTFAFILVWRLVPAAKGNAAGVWASLPSAILISLAMGLLVFSIAHTARDGIASGALSIGCALVAFAAFYFFDSRRAAPLIPLTSFTPSVIAACSISLINCSAATGIWILVSLYMQSVLNFSAAEAGFGMLPWALASMSASQFFAPLLARLSIRKTMYFAMTVVCTGAVLLLASTGTEDYFTAVFGGSAIVAGGIILAQTSVIFYGTSSVPGALRGLVTGAIFSSQTLGASIGATVCLAIVGAAETGTGGSLTPDAFQSGYLAAAIFAAVTLTISALHLSGRLLSPAISDHAAMASKHDEAELVMH